MASRGKRIVQGLSFDSVALFGLVATCGGVMLEAYLTPNFECSTPSDACRGKDHPPLFLPSHIKQLNEVGYAVISRAVDMGVVTDSAVSIDKVNAKNWMSMNSQEIRQDQVAIMRDEDGVDEGIRKILSVLRGVAAQLDAAVPSYTMTHSHKVPLDCQVAVYSPSSKIGYRPHRDNATLGHELEKVGLVEYWRARPYRNRAVTAIIYLNDSDWGDDDGGELELFIGADEDDTVGDTAKEVVRVRPKGGTMVVFDSRRILHTVNPTKARRRAATIWIEGEEREEIRREN
jgi:hypothetical protein